MSVEIEAVHLSKLPFMPGHDTAAHLWIPIQAQPDARAKADGHNEPLDHMELRDVPGNASRLLDADDIVLSADKAKLVLWYPLDIAAVRELHPKNGTGFTRGDLLAKIQETYRAVYEREDESGEFGIRLHGIDELLIAGIVVHRIDGEFWLVPEVDSFPFFLFEETDNGES